MIGFSVGDIIKLLDQIPIWKTLATLPKQVRALEERVAALEAKPARAAGAECPICSGTMKTTKAEPDPVFGDFGLQKHTLECPECGHTETRQVDPKKV